MNYKLSLSNLQAIARKMVTDVCSPRKEVKLSSKPDYVDRTLLRAKKLVAKLHCLAE
jgi:hypothetical protein